MKKQSTLKISVGWIKLLVLDEPTVVTTFKGYTPVLPVKDKINGLEYLMYISARSIAEGLEPLRQKNGNHFKGLEFAIRKSSDNQYAPYEIKVISSDGSST